MNNRIQASTSIIRELKKNGYTDFIGRRIPWNTIDDIDYKLEEIITEKKSYNRQEICIDVRNLVSEGTRLSLGEESINRLTDFIMKKLESYISSGFTQSYHTIESHKYFSYCSEAFTPSKEFEEIVKEVLSYLKEKAKNTQEFEQLIVNFGINHVISKDITKFAESLLLANTGKKREIRIGGQIKLHQPKIIDKDSINWHFDGDPRFIKILCYLEDQPSADGCFSIRSNYENGQYQGSHIKTIIQSINIVETIKRISGIRIQDMGIFLLNSHMPMLGERNMNKYKIDTRRYDTYSPAKFKLIMFKGVECLHKGGNNRKFCRPVYQGIASST